MNIPKKPIARELFVFAVCDCYVWPIVQFERQVRCGRCKGDYEKFNKREAAFEHFDQRHGRMPEPIGEVPWWELPYWKTETDKD